jgi:pimeloyl-ACP methyl ester carboxylesterase
MSDAAVEQSLETGENAGLLQDYFGAAHYDELRRLARASSSRSVRGGERVLILPGIMGTKLGYDRPLFPDIIWADPIDIARGRLSELQLDTRKQIKPQGVILLAYLSLKLRLRIAGFDADFVPYDWRLSLGQLGLELAKLIDAQAKPVYVVAHSMGGLVTRASFSHRPGNLQRVVMLGTPNFGSYAPVQAFRGVYSVIRKLDWLDRRHNLAELAAIFGSFPGLAEMIPSPGGGGAANLFDLANWPLAGGRPAKERLRKALAVQEALPTSHAGVDIVMVAGVGQETVVDARLGADEFVYTLSSEGDGTVPLRLATLPGARHFYIPEEHGRLPGNNLVQKALPSLITTGRTEELDPEPPQSRTAVLREVRESDVPPAPAPLSVNMPSLAEQRDLLMELAAPEQLPLAAAAADLAPAPFGAAPSEELFSDSVVVGRGRDRRLDITLVRGDITEVEASCYVVGLFKAVAPDGAALALDRAMDGRVSDLVARRMFGADVGEVSILPNGRRTTRAANIAFVGLGSFDAFTPDTLALVGENLIRTFVAAGLDDFAAVPFGGGSGADGLSMVRNMMVGFLRGLEDVDRSGRFRSITICERDPERFAFISRALRDLSHRRLFDGVELTFRERHLPQPVAARAPVSAPADERIYLIVREAAEQEENVSKRAPLVASLLTSGAKAAILSGEQPGEAETLDAHLEGLADYGRLDDAAVASFGETLGQIVLPSSVRTALEAYADRHLVVVHDAGASRIPWETLRVGGVFPALAGGISHRYEAANLSVAKWLEQRKQTERLGVLLVVNPTKDLAGAQAEGERIKRMVGALGSAVSLREMWGDEARKSELLACFSSGEFDVVHYAGHAFFDPMQRARSGLLCAGREVLSGQDLAGIGNLPSLMFFNACEAARVRSAGPPVQQDQPSRAEVVQRGIGFAEALLRGGIANFIGTYWPVGDASAKAFAEEFYRQLLEGSTLNEALLLGRGEVKKLSGVDKSQDWADYVFYGDPQFRLKLPAKPSVRSQVNVATARISLDYTDSKAELTSAAIIDAPLPVSAFEPRSASSGAWLSVYDAAGTALFHEPLPDPETGSETVDQNGAIVQSGVRRQKSRRALAEVPWPGEGASVAVHFSPRVAKSRRRGGGSSEIARLPLHPEPLRVRRRDAHLVELPRWGRTNPKALTLLFLPDGFTAAELPRFASVVEETLDAIEATSPFDELLRGLKAARIDLPSNVSGIGRQSRDTCFRGRFTRDRVIEINSARAVNMLNTHVSGSGIALVVANTTDYGGSGGDATVFSCDPTWSARIAVHELGHSLFRLADEYSSGGESSTDDPIEANVSGTAQLDRLKWAAHVAPGTPLPTTQTDVPPGAETEFIGAFEGAKYKDKGIYRPALQCRMRSPEVPFCRVCRSIITARLARHMA